MKQRGMSLLSILIALFINGLLLMTTIQIYLHVKQMLRIQNELSSVQAVGQFIIHYLTHEIRLAGYSQCASTYTPIQTGFIKGYDADHILKNWRAEIASGTDAIEIKRCRYYQGKWHYGKIRFYVASTANKAYGKKALALYVKPNGSRRIELAKSIVDLQFRYVIIDHQQLKYLVASEVKDWHLVYAVAFGVLFKRPNYFASTPKFIYFFGKQIKPNFRKRLLPWYGFVTLRERSLLV